MARPAVFLDRDGTIIQDAEFVGSPDRVELFPDAGPTIRRLNDAGVPVIVVTNQSGIARGYFTVADYERVRAHIEMLLAQSGARIDATYYCPHHPDITGPCTCRKPATGMFRQAAAEHDLDLARSLYVGDRWRDVAPALELGGRGILVPIPRTAAAEVEEARLRTEVAASLSEAIDRWLSAPGATTASVPSASPSR